MADDRKRPPVDDLATVPVPLVDAAEPAQDTPPPLPPSPGSAQAEQWFDDAPTRPSALTDIAPSVPTTVRSGVLSDRAALPALPPPARPSPSYGLLALVALTFLAVGVVVGALLFAPR